MHGLPNLKIYSSKICPSIFVSPRISKEYANHLLLFYTQYVRLFPIPS